MPLPRGVRVSLGLRPSRFLLVLMIDDVVTHESTTPLRFSPPLSCPVFRDLCDGHTNSKLPLLDWIIPINKWRCSRLFSCNELSLSRLREREKVSIGLSVHFFFGFRRPSREQSVMDGSREKGRLNSWTVTSFFPQRRRETHFYFISLLLLLLLNAKEQQTLKQKQKKNDVNSFGLVFECGALESGSTRCNEPQRSEHWISPRGPCLFIHSFIQQQQQQ